MPLLTLRALRDELISWLFDVACPLWQRQGIDGCGGFEETLGSNAQPLHEARRARVHPRQIVAFAQAARLGWRGDAATIARDGIDYFVRHYRRGDGLFRSVVSSVGEVVDNEALLYDQAFALLGFAAAAAALDARAEFEPRARALREAIGANLSAAGGGFRSSAAITDVRESNPHMHLLEACLAWAELGTDPTWTRWAEDLVQLATGSVFRRDCRAMGEVYTDSWLPAPGACGRRIEPGHQYEWAWLLLRSDRRSDTRRRDVAMQLIALGETAGVHGGMAVNALQDDLSPLDSNARLWPQTERLKAVALAATLTGEQTYWHSTLQAAQSLMRFLETPTPGLWFDLHLPNGEFAATPAPASSFYHLVGAIDALDSALEAAKSCLAQK
jgi:mannose-6-phosphate isomerase